jgi:hypothetical protein
MRRCWNSCFPGKLEIDAVAIYRMILTPHIQRFVDMTEASEEKAAVEYRALLVQTQQKSQADFDKAVLTLSGGALGLSFAFTKDIVGGTNAHHSVFLLFAWIAWAASSTFILLSFFTSERAVHKAIIQLDRHMIADQRPGKAWDIFTNIFNASGLILFLFGFVMMTVFLMYNLNLK